MDFRDLVWKRVWIITFFGLKSGQDMKNRAAHRHQEFPGVPPRGFLNISDRILAIPFSSDKALQIGRSWFHLSISTWSVLYNKQIFHVLWKLWPISVKWWKPVWIRTCWNVLRREFWVGTRKEGICTQERQQKSSGQLSTIINYYRPIHIQTNLWSSIIIPGSISGLTSHIFTTRILVKLRQIFNAFAVINISFSSQKLNSKKAIRFFVRPDFLRLLKDWKTDEDLQYAVETSRSPYLWQSWGN